MFNSLLTGWNFVRVIRLVLGLMLLVQSFQLQNWPIALFGVLFVFQSLTNTGCCGAAGCGISKHEPKPSGTEMDKIEYEEVK